MSLVKQFHILAARGIDVESIRRIAILAEAQHFHLNEPEKRKKITNKLQVLVNKYPKIDFTPLTEQAVTSFQHLVDTGQLVNGGEKYILRCLETIK